jgi:peroxiredoxin (alkyl hydroperoxide reductase subunit C)
MIGIGETAPDFSLDTYKGQPFHLADLRGKKNVLLLFFPLAFTPV